MHFTIKRISYLFALSFPVWVQADMFNHKIVLVGDKAAALGGAFSGLADDATATYYNPAGLTQIKNIKLNVSAQVVQYQKQQIGIAPGKIIPYNSFNFSPTITAFSQRMGNWAYGFSIVTPENSLFTGEQSIEAAYRGTEKKDTANITYYEDPECYDLPENPNPCYSKLTLSYYDVPKITLIGPSAAMKYSDNISLGMTLYGIYFTQLEKTAFGGWDANFIGGDPDSIARFRENNVTRSVNQTGLGISGSFGVLVRMNQGFSFGVNVSPGSMVWMNRIEEQGIEIYQNDSLKQVQPDQTDEIPTISQTYAVSRKVKHTEISAPNLALAISWKPWERLLVTAQTDYYLGSRYSYSGFSPLQTKGPSTIARSGFETWKPQQKTYQIDKNSVLNFAAGIDLKVIKGYSVALGGYTDFSQGPHDTRSSAWDRNIDYYGVALSLGMDKEFTESRFGFNAAYGDASITHFQWTTTSGGKPTPMGDQNGNILRLRQNFKAYSFGIFLSSTLKI